MKLRFFFRIQNKENAKIEVFKTPWKGFGVRALEAISKETSTFSQDSTYIYYIYMRAEDLDPIYRLIF